MKCTCGAKYDARSSCSKKMCDACYIEEGKRDAQRRAEENAAQKAREADFTARVEKMRPYAMRLKQNVKSAIVNCALDQFGASLHELYWSGAAVIDASVFDHVDREVLAFRIHIRTDFTHNLTIARDKLIIHDEGDREVTGDDFVAFRAAFRVMTYLTIKEMIKKFEALAEDEEESE